MLLFSLEFLLATFGRKIGEITPNYTLAITSLTRSREGPPPQVASIDLVGFAVSWETKVWGCEEIEAWRTCGIAGSLQLQNKREKHSKEH